MPAICGNTPLSVPAPHSSLVPHTHPPQSPPPCHPPCSPPEGWLSGASDYTNQGIACPAQGTQPKAVVSWVICHHRAASSCPNLSRFLSVIPAVLWYPQMVRNLDTTFCEYTPPIEGKGQPRQHTHQTYALEQLSSLPPSCLSPSLASPTGSYQRRPPLPGKKVTTQAWNVHIFMLCRVAQPTDH